MNFTEIPRFKTDINTSNIGVHKFLNFVTARVNTVVSFLYTFLATHSQSNSLSNENQAELIKSFKKIISQDEVFKYLNQEEDAHLSSILRKAALSLTQNEPILNTEQNQKQSKSSTNHEKSNEASIGKVPIKQNTKLLNQETQLNNLFQAQTNLINTYDSQDVNLHTIDIKKAIKPKNWRSLLNNSLILINNHIPIIGEIKNNYETMLNNVFNSPDNISREVFIKFQNQIPEYLEQLNTLASIFESNSDSSQDNITSNLALNFNHLTKNEQKQYRNNLKSLIRIHLIDATRMLDNVSQKNLNLKKYYPQLYKIKHKANNELTNSLINSLKAIKAKSLAKREDDFTEFLKRTNSYGHKKIINFAQRVITATGKSLDDIDFLKEILLA